MLEIEYDPNGFSLREAIMEAKRCLNCAKPLCRTGCPIENEIPDFIHALARGNLGQASAVIAHRSNLPAVCGRVCPREKQCEGACVLMRTGKGIKIGKIERFIADMEGELDIMPLPKKGTAKGKVAVIGSGPAGLTIAGDLAKADFTVTVFDAQEEPGGVLMYGIPAFRLPKQVVRREVYKIKRLGVTFQTNTMIGTDYTLDDLFKQGFDAIFIGTGNSMAKSLSLDGARLPGVLQATYLLQMVALANQGSIDRYEVPVHEGEHVIVIGAGNTAMDAARTARRQGAASVMVVNRDTAEKMAALPSEIQAAKDEGIEFISLRGPQRFVGTDYVTGLECCLREVQGDKVVDTDHREILPADKVIIAIGQKPAGRIVGSTKGIEVDEGGYVKTRERPYGMTTRHGVFSGGDVAHGAATVVRAMKDAKQVAYGIAQYVEAKKLMEECGLNIEE